MSFSPASEQRTLALGYLQALGGLVIMQVMQVLLGALLVRVFPSADAFGRFNLVQQVIGLAGLLLGLGIDTALVVHLSRERSGPGAHRKFSTAYRFNFWYGLALMIALAAVAPAIARLYAAPDLVPDLRAAAPTLMASSLLAPAQAALMGWGQFGAQALTTIVYQVTNAAALAAGAVLAPQAPTRGAFLTAAAVGLAVAGGALVLVARSGRFSLSPLGPFPDLKPMAAYGVPYWVGNLFKAYQQSFILMLTGLVSLAEVGYLANGWRLAGFVGVVTWGFMIVSLPFVSGAPDPAGQHRRTRMGMRYNHYLLFPVAAGLALYAPEVTTWAFGPAYAASARYLPLLSAGLLLSGVARLGAQCLAAVGRTRATAAILTLPGAVVLVGGPLLIPRAVAAGPWLFLGGWSAATCVSLALLHRYGLPPDWRQDFGRPAACTALAIGAALAGRALGGPWHPLLGAGGLAVAGLLAWHWERPA